MEKINMPKVDGKSADLIQENLEQLKHIFPEVIKEGKVDFEALHDLLGNYTDTPEERFALNWAGKANARREAQKRSTGTLRPCSEESVDWDSTENLYIEGDNLEVLKLLQKSYHSRVKMIYIDPPYNTGKDFVYKDNYKDNMANYLELTGQDKKLSTNTESDGRYHSNWLNMMYPRLKLARNLLTDDGVIFISIDDNEMANLRKVCDEVFGGENFIAQISVLNNPKGRSQDKYIATCHEFLFCYSKSVLGKGAVSIVKSDEEVEKDYSLTDDKGAYRELELRNTHREFGKHNRPNLFYPFYVDGEGNVSINPISSSVPIYPIWDDGFEGCWTWGVDKATIEADRVVAKKVNGLWKIYRKAYAVHNGENVKKQVKSIWTENRFHTEKGQTAFNNLFDTKEKFFQSPKSVDLITELIKMSGALGNDIILDFFSGSATTAHAVMQLNAEEGGNRKYICVQIPEPTPEDSEARKAGYATIPEIAKERIRRAGKKIVEEQKAKASEEGLFAEEPAKLDIGFKVFKLDSSNINAWDSDPNNLETALHNSLFNIKTDRSEDDLLYEILIKYGIELTEKINRHTIAGKTVYEMGAGSLIVCLADNLTTEVAEGIGKLYKEVKPDGVDGNCRVVFKDSGFDGSDEVKTNTMLILKQHGILNIASV